MTNPPDPPHHDRRLFRFIIGMPIASATFEREWLQEQSDELRDEFTPARRDAIFARIRDGAGNSDTLAAQAELDYYLATMQVISQERGTRQMAIATWVLALATIGLFVATLILAFRGE